MEMSENIYANAEMTGSSQTDSRSTSFEDVYVNEDTFKTQRVGSFKSARSPQSKSSGEIYSNSTICTTFSQIFRVFFGVRRGYTRFIRMMSAKADTELLCLNPTSFFPCYRDVCPYKQSNCSLRLLSLIG